MATMKMAMTVTAAMLFSRGYESLTTRLADRAGPRQGASRQRPEIVTRKTPPSFRIVFCDGGGKI
jgi:hypothetical protein